MNQKFVMPGTFHESEGSCVSVYLKRAIMTKPMLLAEALSLAVYEDVFGEKAESSVLVAVPVLREPDYGRVTGSHNDGPPCDGHCEPPQLGERLLTFVS